MNTSAPDPEQIFSDAIDLIADDRMAEADEMLNAFIAALKSSMNGADADAGRYYWWGRALALQEEWEQALLRFEDALRTDPQHEGALWEIVQILMDALDKPESAKTLLVERLLKLAPENPDYVEALASAETLIRRREGRAVQPWSMEAEAGEEAGKENADGSTEDDAR